MAQLQALPHSFSTLNILNIENKIELQAGALGSR